MFSQESFFLFVCYFLALVSIVFTLATPPEAQTCTYIYQPIATAGDKTGKHPFAFHLLEKKILCYKVSPSEPVPMLKLRSTNFHSQIQEAKSPAVAPRILKDPLPVTKNHARAQQVCAILQRSIRQIHGSLY
jgi:hypothetical protein